MGIQGLIPFLEKASTPVNVGEFAGQTVAIDAYCWLHKGVFSCAEKIARGDNCDMYVFYCMKFVNMLLAKNIKPILVFDGQKLPAKMETEKKRRESREQNRKRAAELMRLDRSKEAQTYLRRCIDITHEMALNLIRACRARNIDCIVAPYEADAQLAFLNMSGFADVIVTEDSDLLLFGAKKVLFKMDVNGNGLLIEQSNLHLAMGVKEQDFSFDKFRYMCILSGCDYLSSLPGIGLVKACRFVKSTADPDIYRALSRLSLHLNMPQLCVTQEYRCKFMEADFMFRYQPVYDPRRRCLRPLTDLDPEDENYAKYKSLIDANALNENQIKNLAYGNLDPFKLNSLDDWSPSKRTPPPKSLKGNQNASKITHHPSIWSENYVLNSWSKPKSLSTPPNALCSSVAKVYNKSCSTLNISPTAHRLSSSAEQFNSELEELESAYGTCDSITVTPEEEIKEDTELLNANDDDDDDDKSPSKIPASPIMYKRTHHNPFLKSSQLVSGAKKNVSMLDKLQRLCSSPKKSAGKETSSFVCSQYFKQSEKVPVVEDISESSPSTSPVITGRCSKIKSTYSSEFEHNDTNQRSPLKMLNEDFVTSISHKYSTPLEGDEENQRRGESEDEKEEEEMLSRKRTNPFLSKNAEKKSRVSGFLEKFNSFRRQSVASSFAWCKPENESNTTLEIGTSTAVQSPFKKPERILSQTSDEDEGFCSPNSSSSGFDSSSSNGSGRSTGRTSNNTNSSKPKLSWVSCRASGLKKQGPKQLSLDKFAFKPAVKMKK